MAKFAVGYINFHDNEMIIEIVEGADWKEAVTKHSKLDGDDYYSDAPTLEEAKQLAFNSDEMIDVKEIK